MFPKPRIEMLQWLGEQSYVVNSYIVPSVFLFFSLFPYFFHGKIIKITFLLHKVLLTNLIVIFQMQIWGFNLELLLSFNCISFSGELVLVCNLYNLYNYGDFCSGNHRALYIMYLNFSVYLNILLLQNTSRYSYTKLQFENRRLLKIYLHTLNNFKYLC